MAKNYLIKNWNVTRRDFLKASVAILAGPALTSFSCTTLIGPKRSPGTIRFGIVTDCHYADTDTIGSRYYRHSLDKLAECIKLMPSSQGRL